MGVKKAKNWVKSGSETQKVPVQKSKKWQKIGLHGHFLLARGRRKNWLGGEWEFRKEKFLKRAPSPPANTYTCNPAQKDNSWKQICPNVYPPITNLKPANRHTSTNMTNGMNLGKNLVTHCKRQHSIQWNPLESFLRKSSLGELVHRKVYVKMTSFRFKNRKVITRMTSY